MKYSLLFLLLPFFAFAGNNGEKVEKVINRQFSIQSDGVLTIDNKYGAVNITSGPSNQIKINVSIAIEASNAKKAQDVLDKIDVKFEEGSNKVSATTEVGSSSSWKSMFNNESKSIEINYTVVVPKDIFLELKNKYGEIYVETTNKNLNIDLAYGDLRLGDINADLNLDMTYSEGSVSSFKNGQIELGYAELEMEDAGNVNIKMQYTELSMGSAQAADIDASYSELEADNLGDFIYNGKYADVSVESVRSIIAKSHYTDMEIGGLATNGSITMTYGDLEIENISAVFEKIKIATSYTDVSLEFQDNANFTIEAQTSYCDINHEGLDIIEHIEKGTSNKLKATSGSGGGLVLVKMTYGDLEIN